MGSPFGGRFDPARGGDTPRIGWRGVKVLTAPSNDVTDVAEM